MRDAAAVGLQVVCGPGAGVVFAEPLVEAVDGSVAAALLARVHVGPPANSWRKWTATQEVAAPLVLQLPSLDLPHDRVVEVRWDGGA
ncbi:hypothetical protein DIPPA_19627 [Diplonema papillatum]|nr:hypothetical protein DIPPA_19627 [Diplonema papillatum]